MCQPKRLCNLVAQADGSSLTAHSHLGIGGCFFGSACFGFVTAEMRLWQPTTLTSHFRLRQRVKRLTESPPHQKRQNVRQ